MALVHDAIAGAQGIPGMMTSDMTAHAPTGSVTEASLTKQKAVSQVVELDLEHLDACGVVGFNRKDARTRPFTLLRAQLLKRLKQTGVRMIGITSAAPGAGKSFTAVNLAASLSQLPNVEVTLVDLDLRRGSVATALGIEIERGVADVLQGRCGLADVVRKVSGTNLTIVPTTRTDESGSELFSSTQFDKFIEAMKPRNEQHVVIFDLPPVFADDDAMIVAEKLGAYLLVVDSGHTSIPQIEDCIDRLKPARCLGTVLNRYEGSILDPYGYSYSYSYGY